MGMNRREFLQILAIASAGGFVLNSNQSYAASDATRMYDLPRNGNVSLLHITDSHAQLNPVFFREPEINLGIGIAVDSAGNAYVTGQTYSSNFPTTTGGVRQDS